MGTERKGGGGNTSSWLGGSSHPFPFLALPRHVRASSQDKSDRRTDRQTDSSALERGQGMAKGAVPSAATAPAWMRNLEKKSEGWGHGNLGMSARAAGSARSRRGSGDARFPPMSLGQLGSLSISWSPGAGICSLGSSQSSVLMLKVTAPKLCLLGGSLSSEGCMLHELDLAVSHNRDTEGRWGWEEAAHIEHPKNICRRRAGLAGDKENWRSPARAKEHKQRRAGCPCPPADRNQGSATHFSSASMRAEPGATCQREMISGGHHEMSPAPIPSVPCLYPPPFCQPTPSHQELLQWCWNIPRSFVPNVYPGSK